MTTKTKRRAKCSVHVDEGNDGLEAAAKSVSRLKGVLAVKGNHISHMLGIEYDPDKVTIEEIRRTIENQKG
jgi:hypothetical protein